MGTLFKVRFYLILNYLLPIRLRSHRKLRTSFLNRLYMPYPICVCPKAKLLFHDLYSTHSLGSLHPPQVVFPYRIAFPSWPSESIVLYRCLWPLRCLSRKYRREVTMPVSALHSDTYNLPSCFSLLCIIYFHDSTAFSITQALCSLGPLTTIFSQDVPSFSKREVSWLCLGTLDSASANVWTQLGLLSIYSRSQFPYRIEHWLNNLNFDAF